MSYLMTKILPLLVYPLGLSILLLFGALLWHRRKIVAVGFTAAALVILWVAAMPRFSDWIISTLEAEWPPATAESAPQADAIVLLGGMTRGMVPGMGFPDLSGSADRLFHAAALYRAGKAPVLLLTGGNAEGYEAEAVSMQRMLKFLGIPPDAMLLETQSRNTRQNAVYSAAILNARHARRILLVTSACHMRRAKQAFERQGFAVFPAATDYQVVEAPHTLLGWLPSARSLSQTTRALKEYLGLLVAAVAPGLQN
ncbi:YdcF family protein [Thiolapillus sp.]